MNKQELSEYLRIAHSLHWTPRVDPDIQPPQEGFTTQGFTFLASSVNDAIMRAWSGAAEHGTGAHSPELAPSNPRDPRPRYLFSTELLALRALRNAIEENAARRLARVDTLIAAAEKARQRSQEQAVDRGNQGGSVGVLKT